MSDDDSRPDTTRRARARLVLLAEDDEEMRSFLASALLRDGYRVIAISDSIELGDFLAGAGARHETIDDVDVIVSDIHMPGRTSLEVFADFSGIAARIPIVLITAFGSAETHRRARSLGATAVLDKPFELAELRAVLREAAGDPRAADT